MTTTSHALTGAAIAVAIKKPKLVIPFAFLSHFICDAIPHFGINMQFGSNAMFLWLGIDGLMAISFAILLLTKRVKHPVLLAVAGFVAMSPDLAWLYYGLRGQMGDVASMDPISRFHASIQWFEHPIGIIVEFAWIALMLTIIFRGQNEDHKDITAS